MSKQLTRPQFEQALVLIADGRTIRQIADLLGFHPGTIQRHLLEAGEEYEVAKEKRRDLIRSERWERAFDRSDKWSAKFLDDLSYEQLPETREARSQRVEITGDGGGPVKIESKEVSLTALLQLAADRGVLTDLGLTGSQPALPAAGEVRPAPSE